MFLELKEIAHCLQWKKKVIEEKDEGERRDFHFAQGRCADVSHASLCALIPSNDSFLFHTNPSFRVFLTKTEMFTKGALSFETNWCFMPHYAAMEIDIIGLFKSIIHPLKSSLLRFLRFLLNDYQRLLLMLYLKEKSNDDPVSSYNNFN